MDPLTENEYAYVRNNPFGATDPTGMSEKSRDSQRVKAITASKVGRTTEQVRKEILHEAKCRTAGVGIIATVGAVVAAGPYLSTAAAPLLPRAKGILNKAWDGIKSLGSRAAQAQNSGAQNRASFETYKDGLRAQMEKPHVTDPRLSNLMDKLYRPAAKVGSGSTADAVRYEKLTGQPVGNVFHSTKAQEMSRAFIVLPIFWTGA